MKRTWLEEDVQLIQKYFPGARAVSVRTPFDLSRQPRSLPGLDPSSFHDDTGPQGGLRGGVLWMS